MYRKIAMAGATVAVIVGAGTAALAASGSPTTAGAGKTQAGAAHHSRHALLRRALHGQITTKGKDGYVTHSGVRGTLTAVSATSITVRAVDGYSQTFTINAGTRIRERGATKGTGKAGTPADLKSGDKVGVLGKAPDKSTAAPTATVVIDGLTK